MDQNVYGILKQDTNKSSQNNFKSLKPTTLTTGANMLAGQTVLPWTQFWLWIEEGHGANDGKIQKNIVQGCNL